jgi:uncharacterized membrane protein (UPF0182 family)
VSKSPAVVETPTWKPSGKRDAKDGIPRSTLNRLSSTVFAILFLVIILAGITSYIENWLWMSQLDYSGIFWTLLSVQCVMFCAAFVFAFLYLWLNLRQATTYCGTALDADQPSDHSAYLSLTDATIPTKNALPLRLMKATIILVSTGIALFFALGFYAEWDTYLRFRYGGSFGISDPLFGVDVGFYVFHLPFYELLQNSFTMLTFAAITIVIVVYGLFAPRLRSSSMMSVGRVMHTYPALSAPDDAPICVAR